MHEVLWKGRKRIKHVNLELAGFHLLTFEQSAAAVFCGCTLFESTQAAGLSGGL